MDTEQFSAGPPALTTRELNRIRGDRGRYLRGLELANRQPSAFPWAERPNRVGDGRYRVPSRSTDMRHLVDLTDDTPCPCYDSSEAGNTCQHTICAMILESRYRVRMARLISCAGCGDRVALGDTVEVSDEHAEDNPVLLAGDRHCPSCARDHGIS